MHLLRARAARFLSIAIFLFAAAGANAHVTRVEIIRAPMFWMAGRLDWPAVTRKSSAAFISR